MSVAIANPAMVELPPEMAGQLSGIPTATTPSPDIMLEIPATPLTATGTRAPKEQAKEREEAENMDEKLEESLSTPTSSPPSSFLVSPLVSPSSSTTTDTSVAYDANHYHLTSNTTSEANNKDSERTNDTLPSAPSSSPDADGDIKHASSATITVTSTPASTSSTPTSSSCTSLPAITPSSSEASTSTSPSTTNVQDSSADSNGLLSLLRPRAQFNQNLNVKFAPLPELAPRKRKSSTPLGMAARSQLTRRRKAYQDPYHDDGGYESSNAQRVKRNGHNGPIHPPNEEEIEGGAISSEHGSESMKKKAKKTDVTEHVEDGEKVKVKKEKTQRSGDGQPEVEGDPFVILARKMGKAGKHIWRKMANSGKYDKEGVSGEDQKKANAQQMGAVESITVNPEDGERDGKEGQEDDAGGAWVEGAGTQQQQMQGERVKDLTHPEATFGSEPPLALPFPVSRGSDENLLPDKAPPPTEAEDIDREEDPIPRKEVEVQDVKLGETQYQLHDTSRSPDDSLLAPAHRF
ncbi:hypothetical protein P691DRAFT_790785 [Macrolepiota fuliginosa MF-IS2]|uniref:Uncharacterized protein n=1 Tax=Macrolepiota fuliginosa MF-IS2 TaxID=1400762 RepID=A0A9P6C317_9AGAR|nr:hypothetical protein P691DRAFT_790785 [Macrolepiota fuliginosa MF-IS2]